MMLHGLNIVQIHHNLMIKHIKILWKCRVIVILLIVMKLILVNMLLNFHTLLQKLNMIYLTKNKYKISRIKVRSFCNKKDIADLY